MFTKGALPTLLKDMQKNEWDIVGTVVQDERSVLLNSASKPTPFGFQLIKNQYKSNKNLGHVGYTGHRPVRKITIERSCTRKRCSNHSITRIQQRKKKETKIKNTKKEEENWKKYISVI